jgi:putative ABC transport system substrate-binding protein
LDAGISWQMTALQSNSSWADPEGDWVMNRCTFIYALAVVIGAAPLAFAQPPARTPRIGMLRIFSATETTNEHARQALRESGYVEGKSILIEWRYADGKTERFPTLATELARLKLDAIVATGDLATRAVRQATTTIPVIAGSDDLVGEGHIASLARPGGNITGVSILASELNAKRLELLKAAVSTASRVAVLWDPATGTFYLPALDATARSLKVELKILEIRRLQDLDGAFKQARAWHAQALNVLASPLLNNLRGRIVDQAALNRLPAIYQWPESATAGGFMAYGSTLPNFWRAMVGQLDRVLKGANPAELPVVQPTRFHLVINLKTAKTLGLTIPPSLLLQADEIIQ